MKLGGDSLISLADEIEALEFVIKELKKDRPKTLVEEWGEFHRKVFVDDKRA